METAALIQDLLSLPLLPGGIEKWGHVNQRSWRLHLGVEGGKNPPKENQLKEAYKFPWQGCARAICGLLKVCLILVTLLDLEETYCHKLLWLIEGLYLYADKIRIRKLYFHTLREQSIWPITQWNSRAKIIVPSIWFHPPHGKYAMAQHPLISPCIWRLRTHTRKRKIYVYLNDMNNLRNAKWAKIP